MTKSLPDLARPAAWISWVRLAAVPFALLEVLIERGNYPPGDEAWAWAVTTSLAVGAAAFFAAERRAVGARGIDAAALVFDTAVVSAYTVIYGFEPGSPVRQLFVLVVIEAAVRYGRRGALWAVASAPALAAFEWRQSDRVDVPFDPGHVIGPIGIQVLVGLVVGALVERSTARLG